MMKRISAYAAIKTKRDKKKSKLKGLKFTATNKKKKGYKKNLSPHAKKVGVVRPGNTPESDPVNGIKTDNSSTESKESDSSEYIIHGIKVSYEEKKPKPGKVVKRDSRGSVLPSSTKEDASSVVVIRKDLTTQMGNIEMYECPPEPPYMFDSHREGKLCFEWLIHPLSSTKFFEEAWEKAPLILKRCKPAFYQSVMTMESLDDLLKMNTLWFDKNVDVTSYVNGVRETHNPPGRAYHAVVWDYYQSGCSVRLLNPQTFSRSIWKLCSTLQEFFGSFVGANIYLTPPNSQGFAPHYDDIDAFVLQLSGKKRWKLYSSRSPSKQLPRFSSKDLKESDIGNPHMEVELEPGDLLYMPRGYIHQACTQSDVHSLHITVSANQRNTWGDFLTKMVPRALELALEGDVDLRRSLPRDFLDVLGVANSDLDTPRRRELVGTIRSMVSKLITYLPIDATVDQLGSQFMHDSLPPLLTKTEKEGTIAGNRTAGWSKGRARGSSELGLDTRVKLLRRHVLRLVVEDTGIKVYHSAMNSREYHQFEPQCVDISPMHAQAVEHLIRAYPEYTTVDSLPLDSTEEKVTLATALFENGLLMYDASPSSTSGLK